MAELLLREAASGGYACCTVSSTLGGATQIEVCAAKVFTYVGLF